MDQIKVLEEIGLKKVSQETHIEEKYIKYMVNCDFDKLNHINTLGFVKILTREYKLDLDAWSEAFEEYWLENRKNEESNGLFVVVEDKKSSKKLLMFILLIILISILSLLFSLFKDKINFNEHSQKDEITYEQSASVQEAKKSLEDVNEINNSLAQQEVNNDANGTLEEISNEDVIEKAIVVAQKKTLEKELITDINDTKKKVQQDNIKISDERFENEALIAPNSKLWIGVIYLDDKKRRSYLGEENFSIDLSRNQIITTGHGSFNITINQETSEFNKQAPIRLLVRDGNLSEIKMSEFKKLNKGNLW